jgi:hypothetical protein
MGILQPVIHRACCTVHILDIGLSNHEITPAHSEIRVPQNILQGKDITAVAQVLHRERVSKAVGMYLRDFSTLL